MTASRQHRAGQGSEGSKSGLREAAAAELHAPTGRPSLPATLAAARQLQAACAQSPGSSPTCSSLLAHTPPHPAKHVTIRCPKPQAHLLPSSRTCSSLLPHPQSPLPRSYAHLLVSSSVPSKSSHLRHHGGWAGSAEARAAGRRCAPPLLQYSASWRGWGHSPNGLGACRHPVRLHRRRRQRACMAA